MFCMIYDEGWGSLWDAGEGGRRRNLITTQHGGDKSWKNTLVINYERGTMLWSPRVSGVTVSCVTTSHRPVICELGAANSMISKSLIAAMSSSLLIKWHLTRPRLRCQHEWRVTQDGPRLGHTADTRRHWDIQISGWISAAAWQCIVTQPGSLVNNISQVIGISEEYP